MSSKVDNGWKPTLDTERLRDRSRSPTFGEKMEKETSFVTAADPIVLASEKTNALRYCSSAVTNESIDNNNPARARHPASLKTEHIATRYGEATDAESLRQSRDSLTSDTQQSPASRSGVPVNFVVFHSVQSPKERRANAGSLEDARYSSFCSRERSNQPSTSPQRPYGQHPNNSASVDESEMTECESVDEKKRAKMRPDASFASTLATSQPNLLNSSATSQLALLIKKKNGKNAHQSSDNSNSGKKSCGDGNPELVSSDQVKLPPPSGPVHTVPSSAKGGPQAEADADLVRRPLKGTVKAKVLGNALATFDEEEYDNEEEARKEHEKLVDAQLKNFCAHVMKEQKGPNAEDGSEKAAAAVSTASALVKRPGAEATPSSTPHSKRRVVRFGGEEKESDETPSEKTMEKALEKAPGNGGMRSFQDKIETTMRCKAPLVANQVVAVLRAGGEGHTSANVKSPARGEYPSPSPIREKEKGKEKEKEKESELKTENVLKCAEVPVKKKKSKENKSVVFESLEIVRPMQLTSKKGKDNGKHTIASILFSGHQQATRASSDMSPRRQAHNKAPKSPTRTSHSAPISDSSSSHRDKLPLITTPKKSSGRTASLPIPEKEQSLPALPASRRNSAA